MVELTLITYTRGIGGAEYRSLWLEGRLRHVAIALLSCTLDSGENAGGGGSKHWANSVREPRLI